MYLPNGPFDPMIFTGGAAYPQNLAGVNAPANSLIIVETSWQFPDTGPYLGYEEPAPSGFDYITPGPSTWNSGHSKKRGNITYMDGHAKFRWLKDTFNETGGQNEWRFTKESADAGNASWFYTLLTDLQKYPAND
jgi:prepilin-type processing-associated H-X9-DG protein